MSNSLGKSEDTPLNIVLAQVIERLEIGQEIDLGEIDPRYLKKVKELIQNWALIDGHSSSIDLIPRKPPRLEFSPKPPFSFGDFVIEEKIGSGGMGIVYRVSQRKPARRVAMKILRWGALATEKEKERFWVEIESIAKLRHPNIIPLLEADEVEGIPYLLMPLVEGKSLADMPRESIRQEVQRIAIVARAVAYANAAEIIHRDIKPSNILIEDNGSIFVTDFGLAKQLRLDSQLSSTGDMPGTPRYMAPEMLLNRQRQTIQIDVFSLGVVLYERLTGTSPFKSDNISDLLAAVQRHDPVDPRKLNPGMDRDLATLVLKCLEKLPDNRIASAAELAAELDRWIDGKPIRTRAASPIEQVWKWSKRHYRPIGITAVTALLVSLAWCSILLTTETRATRERVLGVSERLENNDDINSRRHISTPERQLLAIGRLKESQAAWKQGRALDATELLTLIPKEKIDWDWRYLALMYQGALRVLDGHTETITDIKFSQAGDLLFSSGKDRLRVWNWKTGEQLATNSQDSGLPPARDQGKRIVFSHDGNFLFRDAMDGGIRIWDARKLQIIGALSVASTHGRIASLAASSNGKWLAASHTDGYLALWDLSSRSQIAGVQFDSFFNQIKFTPDNTSLIGGDQLTRVTAFFVPELKRQWQQGFSDPAISREIMGLDFLKSGTEVLAASRSGYPFYYSTQSGVPVRTPINLFDYNDLFDNEIAQNTILCVSSKGDRVFVACALSATRVASIQERRASDWKLLHTWQGFAEPIQAIAISPDGSMLAAAGFDKCVHLWSLNEEPDYGLEIRSMIREKVLVLIIGP